MITVFKLLFVPMQTWQRISLARPGVFRILLTQVLPLLLVGLAVESYSLMNWGEYRSGLAALIKVSPDGTRSEIIANGFRAPNGLWASPEGDFFLSTDQE